MNRIKSFTINHNLLMPGFYISREDGDVITYDLRTRKPNAGDYMDNATMHSLEHMFATYIRNSEMGNEVVYFGPMGCQTGFYLLVRNSRSPKEVFAMTKEVLRQIYDHKGEVFGKSAIECGHYENLSLAAAKAEAATYLAVLEEQTVINCIPHRAVRLNLLNTCSVDSRKWILLTFNSVLLKCCVGFRPVHVCGISTPSLVAFHQKVGTCYTNLQVLHIVYRFNLMFAVCDFTETVLCNTHAVESVFTEDFLQLCTCFAVEFRICIVVRIIDERKRNNVETWVKCRVDQVGVHGDLNRVTIKMVVPFFRISSIRR